MKSVGEAMAIGRTFKQAFAKALRSRELDSPGVPPADLEELLKALENGGPDRFDLVLEAFRRGVDVETLNARTSIDPWFLRELQELALDPESVEQASGSSSRSTPARPSSPPARRTTTPRASGRVAPA